MFKRFFIKKFVNYAYRVRIDGLENVYHTNPVVFIANHVSYMDAALLHKYLPGSPIVLIKSGLEATLHDDSKSIRVYENYDQASQMVQGYLKQGKSVCIFPEEQITSNGNMSAFNQDFLNEISDATAPDIEFLIVSIGLMWGSIFSKFYGKVKLRKPKRLPYPVLISIGQAQKLQYLDAGDLRQQLNELSAESETKPNPDDLSFPRHVMRMLKRRPLAKMVKDLEGKTLSNMKFLISTLVLAGKIRKTFAYEKQYVGLFLPPSIGGAIAGIAASFADKAPVFLNYTAGERVLLFACENCEIEKVITSRKFIELSGIEPPIGAIYLEDWMQTITLADKLKALFYVIAPINVAAQELFPRNDQDLQRPATVLFSSGSTGTPKGVVLTQHNIFSNMRSVVRILGLNNDDTILGSLPFFHSFGFLTALWLPISWGIPVTWLANPLDAEAVSKIAGRDRVTMLFATPTFLQGYIRKCKKEDMQYLRLVFTGAEKLPIKTSEGFYKAFDVMPIEGYGTTELSPVVSINIPHDIQDVGKKIGEVGSIGQTIPGVAVRVIDPSTGEVLKVGQEGLLEVKGPNVMKGYLNDPERTIEVLKDGWYNTGDMAKIDLQGYIFITGRLSRFSKIAGEMVPHIGIEERIQDILEESDKTVLVTGVGDPKRGERLIAFYLNTELDVQLLIQKLRESGLPNLWIPKAKDFHDVPEFPLLGSGKLDLQGLKEMAELYC
ncbi:MAG: AMP-binding protein [Lentisphaeria bacterium]|nr:AMP-binding protein [Lentisphaeria bacterium]